MNAARQIVRDRARGGGGEPWRRPAPCRAPLVSRPRSLLAAAMLRAGGRARGRPGAAHDRRRRRDRFDRPHRGNDVRGSRDLASPVPDVDDVRPRRHSRRSRLAEAWTPTADGTRLHVQPARRDLVGRPTGHRGRRRYSLTRARDEDWPYAGGWLAGLDAVAVDEKTVTITARGESALPGARAARRAAAPVRHRHRRRRRRVSWVPATGTSSSGRRTRCDCRSSIGRAGPRSTRSCSARTRTRPRFGLRSPTATSTSRQASPRPTTRS